MTTDIVDIHIYSNLSTNNIIYIALEWLRGPNTSVFEGHKCTGMHFIVFLATKVRQSQNPPAHFFI